MSKNFPVIILIFLFLLFRQSVCSSADKEDEDLLEECRIKSEERFKETYGNEITINEEGSGVNSYQNHYSKKLKKCFVVFTTNDFTQNNKKRTQKFLFSLDDNKEYGFFQSNGTFFCKVMKKKCKSEDEWNLLVKPYLEE